MCGDLDGTHDVQHADECVLEVDDDAKAVLA